MTFVGKVLVVVQLAMSLCFIAFAGAVYTAQKNWKTAALKARDDLDKEKKAFSAREAELTGNLAQRTTERDNEKARADGFQAQTDDLNKRIALKDRENQTLKSENETQRSEAQISAEEATQRREESKRRLTENTQLHASRDGLLIEKRKFEDQIFALNVERQSMIEKHNQLLDKHVKLEQLVRTLGADVNSTTTVASKDAPPPVVEGLVLTTRKGDREGTEFIEISIGSDDGLLKGHDLFVYRNDGKGKYLGKIRLVFVSPDRAVGTVIEKARNGVIEKGDSVTSKL